MTGPPRDACNAATEAVLTMAPPPAACRWGTAAWLTRYIARTLTSCARSQRSRPIDLDGSPDGQGADAGVVEDHVQPAARLDGLATAAVHASGCARSAATAIAGGVRAAARTASAAASTSVGARPPAPRRAPACANSIAQPARCRSRRR